MIGLTLRGEAPEFQDDLRRVAEEEGGALFFPTRITTEGASHA